MTTLLGLDPPDAAERMKSQLMEDARASGDNYIFNWSNFIVALDYFYRGLNKEARR